jgi:hypothetical protein
MALGALGPQAESTGRLSVVVPLDDGQGGVNVYFIDSKRLTNNYICSLIHGFSQKRPSGSPGSSGWAFATGYPPQTKRVVDLTEKDR